MLLNGQNDEKQQQRDLRGVSFLLQEILCICM